MAHDIIHEEFNRSYTSMELALEGDDVKVSLEVNKVSHFYVLPSGLRASLTTSFKGRLYIF